MRVRVKYAIIVITAIWEIEADGYRHPRQYASQRLVVSARSYGEATTLAMQRAERGLTGERQVWFTRENHSHDAHYFPTM